MNIKLTDILWEITPQCNRNCDFCGSSSIKDKKPLSEKELMIIAKKIAIYQNKLGSNNILNITFTGGEPLLLGYNTLKNVAEILKDAGCKVSVITNGDNLCVLHYSIFNTIGISINTIGDIEKYNDISKTLDRNIYRCTYITNFGLHNIFNFDEISEFVPKNEIWQIQLTMGKNQLDKGGIKYLYEKISNCNNKYILADNLQKTHECRAGLNAMSITYDGYCVPCLSARAWARSDIRRNRIKIMDEDGFENTLEYVWENSFSNIRYGYKDCDNCRKHIIYPEGGCSTISSDKDSDVPDDLGQIKKLEKRYPWTYPKSPYIPTPEHEPLIMMYAVVTPERYDDFYTTCNTTCE